MLPSQWPSWIYTSNSPVHLLNFYVVASKFDYWESNFANSFFVPKTAEISKNNLSRTCSKNSGFNGIIKWDNGNWPCSLMSVIFKFSLGQIALKSSLIFQLFSFHITLKFLHFFFFGKINCSLSSGRYNPQEVLVFYWWTTSQKFKLCLWYLWRSMMHEFVCLCSAVESSLTYFLIITCKQCGFCATGTWKVYVTEKKH